MSKKLPANRKLILSKERVLWPGWVSVVVPTFNRSEMLPYALESVVQQSFRPIEIIIVDDGSTDDTEDQVQAWAKKNDDGKNLVVRFFRQSHLGANAARNRGIEEANGEFIAFLDSDDRWLPKKLEKQIRKLQLFKEMGGIYCGIVNVDLKTGERDHSSKKNLPEGNLLKKLLIRDVTEPTSCWTVRRECFSKVGVFDVKLPARQDWDMWIRLGAIYPIGCVQENLVEMGNHPGERIRSKGEREIAAHQIIFEKYRRFRKQFPFWVSLAARSAMYRRRGRVYFHRGISIKKALLMQFSAIVIWPFDFDSYAALLGMVLPKPIRQKLHNLWNRFFGGTKMAIRSH